MLDLSTEFGRHALKRLETEQVVWLTTVRPDGTPDPNPVWFFWDGETFLIFSQPKAWKFRNIANNPRVSLSFNSSPEGGDILVFTGIAELDRSSLPAEQLPAYLEKYRQSILDIRMTPESFQSDYSQAIRVRPERIRGDA